MRRITILVALPIFFFYSSLSYLCAQERQNAKEEARQHYQQGEEFFSQGRYQEATAEFEKTIELISPPKKVEFIEEAQKQQAKILSPPSAEKLPLPPHEIVEKEIEEKEPQVLEYTIGEEDVLYISVWQEEDLSQEVIVRPDGKISFSLAGDVPAAGLTFTQLKEELTKRLKDYVKYPVISVSLKKLGGKKVIVLGEVGSAGVYSVTGKCTVLEAIGRAGGFTPHAVPSSTIIITGGLQNPKGTRLNLTRAIDKTDMSQNVTLQPEDVIYVPKKFIANVNYAITQILGPLAQGATTVTGIQSRGD